MMLPGSFFPATISAVAPLFNLKDAKSESGLNLE